MAKRWMHYQYISFDVFDTLIKRSVAVPSDIFRLMERQCADWDIAPNFAEKRMQANRLCEEKAGGKPVSLADIYNELQAEYGPRTGQLMELELRMEIDGCRPNEDAVALFRACMEAGKTVVLISDMYLPAASIATMLDKCGIRGYKKLYVSCEMGARKRNGTLFRVVVQELGIKPAQLLHIGDSRRSDILQAYASGIRACHIKNGQKELMKVPQSVSAGSALTYRTLSACIRNCAAGLTEYEKQGCEIFGPLLLGFSQWLAGQLRKDEITDVFFLSRDGYTMKRAFDCLYPTGFRTYYLYASRRALTVPLYWRASSLDDVFAVRNYSTNSRLTLRTFLKAVGLEPEHYTERAAEYGLTTEHVYSGKFLSEDAGFRAFYATIEDEIKANSRREYEALLAYLKQFEMYGRIAVVDVGYKGTIQRSLLEILTEAKMDVAVKGYYIGLCPTAPFVLQGEIDARGYVYDRGKNEDLFYNMAQYANIVETLFCEPCGSAERFMMQGGKGIPVLAECEYTKKEGRLLDEMALITEYQEGAQKLVEYFHQSFPDGIGSIEADAAVFRLVRMGISPTLREAKLWGDVRYDKSIESGTIYIARPRSYWTYLRCPAQLKEDIYTSWRIGFLKRLLLLPLPYEKVFYWLKGLYEKNGKFNS